MTRPGGAVVDAVVVGAGMGGLACATRLAQLGRRVSVCEARRVLGGRASSWIDPRLGVELDNGPHLFAGAYRETAALLARVGASDRLRADRRLRVPLRDADGSRAVLAWGAAPGWLGLAQGFARFSVLSAVPRARLLAVLLAARRPDAGAGVALGSWLDSLGQRTAARRWLWDPLARAVFNDDPDRVSAALFAAVVRRLFLGGARAAALAHATVGLSTLYAEPAAAYLESRGSVVLRGVTARAVRPGREGFAVDLDEGEPLLARSVCLAVPAEHALALARSGGLPALPGLAQAAAVRCAPLVSVNLWLAGAAPALDEPFAGFVDSEFAWCFERTQLTARAGERTDPAPGRHVVLVAPGARALLPLPVAEVARRAHAALVEHAPACRARPLVATRVIKETRAAPSLTPAAAAARPTQATPVAGLALAGDWTETGLPATLESAAASGHAAAAILHRFLARGPAC